GESRGPLVDDHVSDQNGRLRREVVARLVRVDLDVLVLDQDLLAPLPVLVLLELDRLLRVEADLAALLGDVELDLEVRLRLEPLFERVGLREGILGERRKGGDGEQKDRAGKLHASMLRIAAAGRNAAPVFAATSSTPTPGASSMSSRPAPDDRTSKTQRSVMMRWTQRCPVNGRVQRRRILCSPDFAVCSIVTTSRRAPA